MKAGTQNHLKVKRLMRLLSAPMYRVVGILETIFLLCQDCCDEGDIGKYTDDEIADYLGWDGPQSPSELVRALSDAGWFDPDIDRRLVVHDWLEHAPEYIKERVRKRLARGGKARKQKTYDQSKPDNTGHTRDQPPLVPSIPNPTQPNPTNPNQTKGEADSPSPKNPSPDPPADLQPPAPAKIKPEDVPVPESLRSEPFLAARIAWIAMRRRKRCSLRPEYVANQYDRLLPLGPDLAAACLKYSTDNDYEGVFPERFTRGHSPNKLRPGSVPAKSGERGL